MPKTLLDVLRAEKAAKLHGGIYHRVQIDLTYNSNHIEGSRLTHDQTRFIFETNTIGMSDGAVKVDDVVETANHFKCIDMIIDRADGIVTVCEMKYSKDDYRLTEAEYRKIVRRMEVFGNETGHKGGVQATVVTTYALKDNMYSEISPVAVTMKELFMVNGNAG